MICLPAVIGSAQQPNMELDLIAGQWSDPPVLHVGEGMPQAYMTKSGAMISGTNLEARVGFEPTNGGFADLSLRPLGYRAGAKQYSENAIHLSVAQRGERRG